MFLEAAVRGNARYLVSRDDDLMRDLELAVQMESRGIQVISVQQLLDILSGSVDG
jgi:predicted nucleic acid-binding protein